VRTIRGNDTLLADPHGIALDLKNRVIFVSNFGNGDLRGGEAGRYGRFDPPSITVYPMDGMGNIKPLRVIQGPKTMMNWPSHLAFHQERQELFVANDADSSVLVFRASDQGDAAPIRVIKGPKTGIKNPPGIALDAKLSELYVANMGTPSITVFPLTADGDVVPLRTIRGGPKDAVGLLIGNPGSVGYDTKREQILVPN
jgi:DNA-binding beta-propeller fold protein YncE